jgi:hypothetical protein
MDGDIFITEEEFEAFKRANGVYDPPEQDGNGDWWEVRAYIVNNGTPWAHFELLTVFNGQEVR